MHDDLDSYDRHILALLQEDASRPSAEIAELVGISQSPCWRRMQRLKEEGYITRQVAIVDRRKVGLKAQIFAQVKLTMHGKQNLDAFAEAVKTYPEVLECHVLLGNFDFLLRVVAADTDAYQEFFFERLSRLPGVQEVISIAAISEIKSTTALPLQPPVRSARKARN